MNSRYLAAEGCATFLRSESTAATVSPAGGGGVDPEGVAEACVSPLLPDGVEGEVPLLVAPGGVPPCVPATGVVPPPPVGVFFESSFRMRQNAPTTNARAPA